MQVKFSTEEGLGIYEGFMVIGGTRKSVLNSEKHPDFYALMWWGAPQPERYLQLIQELLERTAIPRQTPYRFMAFVKGDPQQYEVEPPLTWQEVLDEFGESPKWFRYETGVADFTYFPESGEPFTVLHSARDPTNKILAKRLSYPIGIPEGSMEYSLLSDKSTGFWIPMINELSYAKIPQDALSRFLTDLGKPLI